MFSHLTCLGCFCITLRNKKPRRQCTGALCVQHSLTAAALSTSFPINHAPNTPYSWTHWWQDLGSHTAAWIWVVSRKGWRNQAAGWIQAMHWYSIEGKMQFSRFSVLPGSAETQVNWCGVVKRLLIAYFIGNISAKKYQNPFTCVRVIASQRWDIFLRHGVVCNCVTLFSCLSDGSIVEHFITCKCAVLDWQCRHSDEQGDWKAEGCDRRVEEQATRRGLWTLR